MVHGGSNVAKKIDAWIQKKMKISQHHGCTVAYKENNVYNIHMKPKGNKTDAMPLSEDSDNRSSDGCRPGPNLQDRKIQIQKIQEEQEEQKEHMIQCEMMRWMVKSLWCRGCQIYLLNSARQIAEHELTGRAVYKSWCRHCVGSKCRPHGQSCREEGELPENWH